MVCYCRYLFSQNLSMQAISYCVSWRLKFFSLLKFCSPRRASDYLWRVSSHARLTQQLTAKNRHLCYLDNESNTIIHNLRCAWLKMVTHCIFNQAHLWLLVIHFYVYVDHPKIVNKAYFHSNDNTHSSSYSNCCTVKMIILMLDRHPR